VDSDQRSLGTADSQVLAAVVARAAEDIATGRLTSTDVLVRLASTAWELGARAATERPVDVPGYVGRSGPEGPTGHC
jgi:hypothetical protein